MYRRNIGHILIPLAVGLALVIGYNLFLKPVLPPQMRQLAESLEPLAPPPAPPASRSQGSEAKSVRVLDQSVVPSTPHEGLLEAIRDEIEKHNLSLAETKLKELSPSVLSDARTKPFVATLWNNLGLQQERLNGTPASVKAFKRAADLDESNPVILMNLAHAYWEQRDRALNEEFLTKLMKVAPDEPFPHLAMADLLQERDQLEEAAKHLDQAADRARQEPTLQSYLAAVMKKIRRTLQEAVRTSSLSSTVRKTRVHGSRYWRFLKKPIEKLDRNSVISHRKRSRLSFTPRIRFKGRPEAPHGQTASMIPPLDAFRFRLKEPPRIENGWRAFFAMSMFMPFSTTG
jgi:tetratricopeptide (TPR) repeat protein